MRRRYELQHSSPRELLECSAGGLQYETLGNVFDPSCGCVWFIETSGCSGCALYHAFQVVEKQAACSMATLSCFACAPRFQASLARPILAASCRLPPPRGARRCAILVSVFAAESRVCRAGGCSARAITTARGRRAGGRRKGQMPSTSARARRSTRLRAPIQLREGSEPEYLLLFGFLF